MAATIYEPLSTAHLKSCTVDFDSRPNKKAVNLVQYDQTIPVLCVSLKKGGTVYKVPSDADVNIRMDKRDGYHVYNPALGVNAERTIAYFAVTPQMSTGWGDYYPIVEITVGGGIAGSAPVLLHFDRNPLPENAIISSDEYKTLEQIVADVNNAVADAAASATRAESAAKTAGDAATKVISEGVAEKLTEMQGIQEDVKARQQDVTEKQADVTANVELARQAALSNGYMQMGVDPDTGHLMYTRTTNLKDKLDFAIVNDTNLEVQIHG